MADVFDKEKRSEVMSRVKGRGNRTTEMRMVELFRRHGITGWRRHLNLPGKPDFAFPTEKVAVFIDGCFWHGCPRCYAAPKSNVEYWEKKLHANRRRDERVARRLRNRGWSVLRIWECRLREDPARAVRRVLRPLEKRRFRSVTDP